MGKYVVLSKSKDNNIKYISNTSPLLWTDNKNKAKIFRNEGEILTDLSYHQESLEKMKKELGLEFESEEIYDI